MNYKNLYYNVVLGVEPVTEKASPMNQLVESTANLARLQNTATEVSKTTSI